MKNVEIILTKKEAQILRKHFSQNLSYGYSGTFGDGDKFHSSTEYKNAQVIQYKIEKALGVMK